MTSARSRGFAIVASALAVFLVCLLVFALQARSARQAAMASAVPAAAVHRRVLERRVVVRRIVVHLRPARGADDGGPARAVVITSPAPAATAPVAPAPAAPAPAPAAPPLVTHTS